MKYEISNLDLDYYAHPLDIRDVLELEAKFGQCLNFYETWIEQQIGCEEYGGTAFAEENEIYRIVIGGNK
jgi:hypothetical protein